MEQNSHFSVLYCWDTDHVLGNLSFLFLSILYNTHTLTSQRRTTDLGAKKYTAGKKTKNKKPKSWLLRLLQTTTPAIIVFFKIPAPSFSFFFNHKITPSEF
ncbi:hypothetical protein A4A49_02733 [Nicotiana attenuata]|uniref:Uncharacterized protein n=1 Tax=Nicotiana attenuata TaxID=49451 RepID=A0A314L1H9_NICAT|nr:hypothetical protein A4A49_02733 [Nicotiana attenuata]